MKEKNIIFTARIMSMIFTPLLSADSGIDSTVHLQLHVIVADDV